MEPDIKIVNLSFTYPDGRQALSNISVTIGQSETVGLIGPNGAGKSTLLLHLNGILRHNGAVTVLGKKVDEKNLKWVRAKVGLVFQNPDDQLFSPTVFDDVAFGAMNMGCTETEVRQRVSSALAQVGMTGYEQRIPHHLSMGEKRRVAIATVLAMEPAILVTDEPSSNLDPRAKWALVTLLQKLPQTKLIASHDLELVRALCSRVLVLDHGTIIRDGSTAEIMDDVYLMREHGLAADNEFEKVSW